MGAVLQSVDEDVDDMSIESALKALGTDWMNNTGARAQGGSSSAVGASGAGAGPSSSQKQQQQQQQQQQQDGQSNGGTDAVEPVVVERKKKKKKKKKTVEIGEPAPSGSSGLDDGGSSKSKKSPALSVL